MGRSPSFEECLKPGEELQAHLRLRPGRAEDRRHRPGPRGDRPQQLDPRRRGGDRRPAAAGDRAAAARRGPRRAATATGTGTASRERAYKIVTQYSMGPIEEIGLLKMDFLGLRNLDVIEDAVAIIERSRGERDRHRGRSRSTTRRPTRCSRRGESIGVFQFESEGMRDALREGAADRVPGPRRARRPLPARGDALHPRLRQGQARPGLDPLPGPAPAPDHRGDLRLRDLPGAADGDRQADGRLQPAPRRTTSARRSARRSAT